MATQRYRRTKTLSDDPTVLPCWRKGYEFWGHEDLTNNVIVEEHFDRLHTIGETEKIG